MASVFCKPESIIKVRFWKRLTYKVMAMEFHNQSLYVCTVVGNHVKRAWKKCIDQILTPASGPSSALRMAPTVISVSFSVPLSVTLTDAIFAPAAAATAAVSAPSPAIVAVTIRVPPYWVTVIIPLPWAIVSLSFISSSLNLRRHRDFYEWKISSQTPKCKTDTYTYLPSLL